MSLFDSLLLDEYRDPKSVWIHQRADGQSGSGSITDPSDGGVIAGPTLSASVSYDDVMVVVLTSTDHGYSTSDSVAISGVTHGGAVRFNDTFSITVISNRAFSLLLGGLPAAPPYNEDYVKCQKGSGTLFNARLFWPVAVVTATSHGFTEYEAFSMSGASVSQFNGDFVAIGVTASTFRYRLSAVPGSDQSSISATCRKLNFRFDKVMDAVPENSVIHLGSAPPSNPFRTRGVAPGYVSNPGGDPNGYALYVGYQVKTGQKILGSGIGATNIRLEFAMDVYNATAALGRFGPVNTVEVSDLCIDAAISLQLVPHLAFFAPVTVQGTMLYGGHGRVRRVRAINWATQVKAECFVLTLFGSVTSALGWANNVLEDCIVDKPGENNYGESTTLWAHGTTSGVQGSGSACVVRYNFVDCSYAGAKSSAPIKITEIVSQPDPTTGLFNIKTAQDHNRVAGNNVLMSNVMTGAPPSGLPHPYLVGSFRIVTVVGVRELELELPNPPSPVSYYVGVSVNPRASIGVDYHGPAAFSNTGGVMEGNSCYECLNPAYTDTGTTRDAVMRDNYIYGAMLGVNQNLAPFGGVEPFPIADSVIRPDAVAQPRLAEVTTLGSTNHNLSVGDLVTMSGVTCSGTNPYNGTFAVVSKTSTTFRYQMKSDPGGNPTNPVGSGSEIRYPGRWQVRRFVIENNVFDLLRLLDSNFYTSPRGVLANGALDIEPYMFPQWVIRYNAIRNMDGVPGATSGINIGDLPAGVRIKSVEGALIQENLIDVASPIPIQHLKANNVKSFNNQSMSGTLLQGHDSDLADLSQKDDESATWIDDVVVAAL